jgi:DNA-binding NarL/FixJ family response regulator
MENVKILIVDDHTLLTDSIAEALRKLSWVEYVKVENSSLALLKDIEDGLYFDVIVSDIQMNPGLDGIATMQKALKINPNLKFIFVSQFENPLKITQALDLGAKGYICKSEGFEVLQKALNAVLEGATYLSPLATSLMKKLNNPVDGTNILTASELKVLTQIQNGLSNPEIAENLFISISTVETHRKAIHKKLGVKNLSELLNKMKEMGLV